MNATLRLCLYDQFSTGDEFRQPFDQVTGITVIGTYTNWEGLQDCLCFGNADIVVVNLDGPNDTLALSVISRIGEVAPGCSIIGVSHTNDPNGIIGAMRAGCEQFVRGPIVPSDLQGALDRVRAIRLPMAAESRRIAVVGSSGGSGATTIACNLVLELAQLIDRRCALVDLDLEFGEVACSFDATPKYSMADVCRAGTDVDRVVLESALLELPCNVSILARPDRIEDAREVTAEGVEQMFRVLSHMFPFVVTDMPRNCGVLTAQALAEMDRILIIAQMSVPYLRNATRIYEYLNRCGVDPSRVEIVLNRVNANFERITPEEVEKHFGRPVFALIPNDYRRVVASRDFGHPMVSDAPKSPARRAIQQMARLLSGPQKTAAEQAADNGSLIGKLLGRRSKA